MTAEFASKHIIRCSEAGDKDHRERFMSERSEGVSTKNYSIDVQGDDRPQHRRSLTEGFQSLMEGSKSIRNTLIKGGKSLKASGRISDGGSGGTMHAYLDSANDVRLMHKQAFCSDRVIGSSQEVMAWGEAPPVAAEFGGQGSLRHRVMLFMDGKEMSWWHSIPLKQGGENLVNCVCTTPAGSWIRRELAQEEPFNPLRIMERDGGRPSRFADDCPWNLAVLPQTWADPDLKGFHKGTSKHSRFDGRPLEVIEIGDVSQKKVGDIYTAKILAGFFVLEEGKALTWKLVAISTDDPLSDLLHNVIDMTTVVPGTLKEIRDWISTRHSTEPGFVKSTFPLGGLPLDQSAASEAIVAAHLAWKSNFKDKNLPANILLPGMPPIPFLLEKAFHSYTAKSSQVVLPFHSCKLRSAVLYDRAWADTAESEEEHDNFNPDLVKYCTQRSLEVNSAPAGSADSTPPTSPFMSSHSSFSSLSSFSSCNQKSPFSSGILTPTNHGCGTIRSCSPCAIKTPTHSHGSLLSKTKNLFSFRKGFGWSRKTESSRFSLAELKPENSSKLTNAETFPSAKPARRQRQRCSTDAHERPPRALRCVRSMEVPRDGEHRQAQAEMMAASQGSDLRLGRSVWETSASDEMVEAAR